jgi:hypothetical protein
MRLPIAILACFLLSGAHAQSLLPKAVAPIGLLNSPQPVVMPPTLPSPWSYQQLGLFCKVDVQLERRIRMPVLFRLGDVQQVEAWEGKGALRMLPVR